MGEMAVEEGERMWEGGGFIEVERDINGDWWVLRSCFSCFQLRNSDN